MERREGEVEGGIMGRRRRRWRRGTSWGEEKEKEEKNQPQGMQEPGQIQD